MASISWTMNMQDYYKVFTGEWTELYQISWHYRANWEGVRPLFSPIIKFAESERNLEMVSMVGGFACPVHEPDQSIILAQFSAEKIDHTLDAVHALPARLVYKIQTKGCRFISVLTNPPRTSNMKVSSGIFRGLKYSQYYALESKWIFLRSFSSSSLPLCSPWLWPPNTPLTRLRLTLPRPTLLRPIPRRPTPRPTTM